MKLKKKVKKVWSEKKKNKIKFVHWNNCFSHHLSYRRVVLTFSFTSKVANVSAKYTFFLFSSLLSVDCRLLLYPNI